MRNRRQMGRLLQAMAVALHVTVVVGWQVGLAQAAVTETYRFRDSFAPDEGSGDVLVPVYNGTGTILTGGAGFVDGAFVTETISASACASAPAVRAWSFPAMGGLRSANMTPTVVTGSYSISMLMRYNPMDSGYARLIDFSNSTQDAGIYKLGNGVSFYPLGSFAAGSFVSDQDVFVTITRDAGTQLVSLYINGAPAGSFTDSGNLYVPLATTMYFLMDNTTGSAAISETDPGVIAYLQLSDTPMAAGEVAASLSAICNSVSCGDGIVAGNEACDDGNGTAGDGCSPTCTVEPGWTCSGSPSACSQLPTITPTLTPPIPTSTPAASATATRTPSNTATATGTPTSTSTSTRTSTSTNTPTRTPTSTPTSTSTTPTPLGLGDACSSGTQCGSTFCVGRVCCTSACDAPGQSCTLPGRVGICTSTSPAPAVSGHSIVLLAIALLGLGAFSLRRETRRR